MVADVFWWLLDLVSVYELINIGHNGPSARIHLFLVGIHCLYLSSSNAHHLYDRFMLWHLLWVELQKCSLALKVDNCLIEDYDLIFFLILQGIGQLTFLSYLFIADILKEALILDDVLEVGIDVDLIGVVNWRYLGLFHHLCNTFHHIQCNSLRIFSELLIQPPLN